MRKAEHHARRDERHGGGGGLRAVQRHPQAAQHDAAEHDFLAEAGRDPDDRQQAEQRGVVAAQAVEHVQVAAHAGGMFDGRGQQHLHEQQQQYAGDAAEQRHAPPVALFTEPQRHGQRRGSKWPITSAAAAPHLEPQPGPFQTAARTRPITPSCQSARQACDEKGVAWEAVEFVGSWSAPGRRTCAGRVAIGEAPTASR